MAPFWEALRGVGKAGRVETAVPVPEGAKTPASEPVEPLEGAALEDFLLGQGVEPEPEAPVDVHGDLWMLGACSPRRRIAFTEGIGTRFGDLGLTTRFVLDRWAESPGALRYILDPAAPEAATVSARAEDILAGCLVKVRTGLAKRAVSQHDGDMEQAIVASIHEQMDVFGLEMTLPEPAEA